jgi:exopolysaccharide biosynthesis polyprenyl glycosylphosphotransferase
MRRRSISGALIPLLSLVLLDILLLWLAYWLAYVFRFELNLMPVLEPHSWRRYVEVVSLQMILLPVVFAFQGLYRARRTISLADELYGVFTATSMNAVIVLAITVLVARDFIFSRGMLVFGWILAVAFVTAGRYLHFSVRASLRAAGVGTERALIVGTNDTSRMVAERIYQSPQLGYRPLGFLSCRNGESADSFAGLPVLGQLDDIGRVVREYKIEHVIVAIPGLSHEDMVELVSECRSEDVSIRVFPDVFHLLAGQVTIDELNGLPLVTVKEIALRGYGLAIKRMMDLLFSAAGLVLLSGPLLLLAMLIKITSPGAGAFYSQERVGLDGKPFQMIKFRTMRPDAEADTGPVWTVQNDPRRTRTGLFLGRFSLDELPQLVNVLVGEMSLVGPRPERPYFVEQFGRYIPRYHERHREKAGITGWAQVNGLRGDTSIEERTAYDLWYVENWTVWLDIKILLRSLVVIFKEPNAY